MLLLTKVSKLSFFVDVDECASAPCQNGGTCVDEEDSFRCECPLAWEGNICQFGKLYITFTFKKALWFIQNCEIYHKVACKMFEIV